MRRVVILLPLIMGTTKSLAFSVKDNRIARYAKALSHPARIVILQILVKKQTCTCSDFVEELPLSQSTVSQHLKELKASGLIKKEMNGSTARYSIDEKEWELTQKYLNSLFAPYPKMNVAC